MRPLIHSWNIMGWKRKLSQEMILTISLITILKTHEKNKCSFDVYEHNNTLNTHGYMVETFN